MICAVEAHDGAECCPGTKGAGAEGCDRARSLGRDGVGWDAGGEFGIRGLVGVGCGAGVDLAGCGEGEVGLDAVC